MASGTEYNDSSGEERSQKSIPKPLELREMVNTAGNR